MSRPWLGYCSSRRAFGVGQGRATLSPQLNANDVRQAPPSRALLMMRLTLTLAMLVLPALDVRAGDLDGKLELVRGYCDVLDSRKASLQSLEWTEGRCGGTTYTIWFQSGAVVAADCYSRSRQFSSMSHIYLRDGEACFVSSESWEPYSDDQAREYTEVIMNSGEILWAGRRDGGRFVPLHESVVDNLVSLATFVQARGESVRDDASLLVNDPYVLEIVRGTLE